MRNPLPVAAWLVVGALALRPGAPPRKVVGRQADGSFIVSTGQRVGPGGVPFHGRITSVALSPDGRFLAVALHDRIEVVGLLPREARYPALTLGGSHTGCAWSSDGRYLYVSLRDGLVARIAVRDRPVYDRYFALKERGERRNPCPGGMAVTRDGSRLYVCCTNRGTVAEFDTQTGQRLREIRVQSLPFDVKLTPNERILVVSNWGGRPARAGEDTAESGGVWLVVDRRGVPSTGSVSLVDRQTGAVTNLPVGLHPAGLAVDRSLAWVANAGSDSVTEIDVNARKVRRTIPVTWDGMRLFGSLPNALAVRGNRLYACTGGDNALCEVDLRSGRTVGFRPAGYFPMAVALSADGNTAYVANNQGNGSVRETVRGKPGNVHQFQGTVSRLDLRANLQHATDTVARQNDWYRARSRSRPSLAVYNGAIRHVLYIIKENRTYDEVLGDMPQGNGSPSLCGLGEAVTPNHHALARQFALFDNAYAVGTNSAEGHQWALEGLANDYIMRFYGGYVRSYPYDGGDAMAYSSNGFLWDAAAAAGKSVRVYGEFCSHRLARITPVPRGWLDLWLDRQDRTGRFQIRAGTTVAGMRRFLHPRVVCWPLSVSDQWRADQFIQEYQGLSRANRVPNLMILTLPSDHTVGTFPGYPTPRSMVADNDLALGRVVEAVSRSPQWRQACIFVIEDDAQAGPDHVDGHRTVCLVVSPYIRRGVVDSTLYTQASVLRSIELMLGLQPMTRFDALATPFGPCFANSADLRPYRCLPNRVPLAQMNPPARFLRGAARERAIESARLDWSDVDRADWGRLSRIVWHSLHGERPYPGG